MKYSIFVLILCISISCSSWKESLRHNESENNIIHNVITDFTHTSSLYRKNKVFHVSIRDIKNDIIVIGVFPSLSKFLPEPEDTIGNEKGYIPTNFVEQDGKLFYWRDSTKVLTKEVVEVFNKFNLIDSININGFIAIPEGAMYMDERQMGVDYYICRNNLKKYKKVANSIAYGYYEAPKLNCE